MHELKGNNKRIRPNEVSMTESNEYLIILYKYLHLINLCISIEK